MAGEAPGGGVVHVAGGEGVEAQLGGPGVDVLHHGLEGFKVLDVLHLVAGLLHQVGVDDDAVALVAVADGHQLAVLVIEVVGVGVQLVGDGGAGQVQGVVGPVAHAGLVAHVEDGGGLALAHLGVQGLAVGAGGGGDDLHRHAGLLGVHLGHVVEHLVGLRLEVEPVDAALGLGVVVLHGLAGLGAGRAVVGGGLAGLVALAGASSQQHGHDHAEGHYEREEFLTHFHFLLIFVPDWKRFW